MTTATPVKRMAKEKQGKQVNVRVDDAWHARLERVANGLGLEVSSFIRMMIVENIKTYEERVAKLQEPGESND